MTSPIEHGLDEEQKVFIRKKVPRSGIISPIKKPKGIKSIMEIITMTSLNG